MKTIIVATDYSSTAENAIKYAAQLARHTGAKMVLLNVFHLPAPSTLMMMPRPDFQRLMEDKRARLQKTAEAVAGKFGVPVETKSSMGLLLDELEDLSSQYEDPLVVVGMRGNSLERKIFGSLTISVLQQAKYPVLVVPAEAQFREIAKILFACDYNSISILHQLNPLKAIARKFKARIQVLHIVRTPALVSADVIFPPKPPKMETHLRGIKHSYKEVEQDDIIEGIEKGLQDYNADMLVMVPHKAGFWDYILNWRNTPRMALRTRVPLLAMPNQHL